MTVTGGGDGSDLVDARHDERLLDERDPGVGVEGQELLHLFAVGHFRDGTQLLREKKRELVDEPKTSFRSETDNRVWTQGTFRKVSRSPFLASILSLSMFPNGMSGNIFFGPLTAETFKVFRIKLDLWVVGGSV